MSRGEVRAVHGSIRHRSRASQRERRRTVQLSVSVPLWSRILWRPLRLRASDMRLTLNGKRTRSERASAEASARRAARGLRADRDEGRLRRRRVRRVHRARRRRAGQLVPGARGPGGRHARDDDRRAWRPPSAAARVRRARRRAVRHLHAGHDHGGGRARSGVRRSRTMRVGLAGNLCRCTGYSGDLPVDCSGVQNADSARSTRKSRTSSKQDLIFASS